MKRSTPIKYTANTSRYNIRSKSDKPSGRKDTGGFFFYTYLRSADFLPRLFALRRKRQSMIKLPCNKCNGCVSSSSHRLKSAGALIMQLRPSLYLSVASTSSHHPVFLPSTPYALYKFLTDIFIQVTP